jgi:DMSO reductase anchor subunit
MKEVHTIALLVHVTCGFGALGMFWVAALTRKGGRRHRQAGRAYVGLMMGAVAGALVMAGLLAVAPHEIRDFGGASAQQAAALTARLRGIAGLFFALALLTFTAGWNGLAAIRSHGNPAPRGLSVSLVLAALNAAVAGPMVWFGLQVGEPLLLIFAIFCLSTGVGGIWRRRKLQEPGGWLTAHASSMIATGIAAHTAFLAVGAVRILPQLYSYSPALSVIPWLAPSIIGTVAIIVIKRRLRRGTLIPTIAANEDDRPGSAARMR